MSYEPWEEKLSQNTNDMINRDAYLIEDLSKAEKIPTRDGYGKGLVELGEKDDRVVVLCADLAESTRSHWFKEKDRKSVV